MNFSLPPRSEQVNGAVANELKHVHSPEVIVVFRPQIQLIIQGFVYSYLHYSFKQPTTMMENHILWTLRSNIRDECESTCRCLHITEISSHVTQKGNLTKTNIFWLTTICLQITTASSNIFKLILIFFSCIFSKCVKIGDFNAVWTFSKCVKLVQNLKKKFKVREAGPKFFARFFFQSRLVHTDAY